MLLIAFVSCVLLSTASFAWGYQRAGYEGVVNWIIAFGIGWLASAYFRWRWFSIIAVLAALTLAAFGIWFGFTPGWLFMGAVFALFAYDLTEFQERLKALPTREDIAGRTRRRLIRIGFLVSVGLILMFLLGWFRG